MKMDFKAKHAMAHKLYIATLTGELDPSNEEAVKEFVAAEANKFAEDLITEIKTQAEFEFATNFAPNLSKEVSEDMIEILSHVFVNGAQFGFSKAVEKEKLAETELTGI